MAQQRSRAHGPKKVDFSGFSHPQNTEIRDEEQIGRQSNHNHGGISWPFGSLTFLPHIQSLIFTHLLQQYKQQLLLSYLQILTFNIILLSTCV